MVHYSHSGNHEDDYFDDEIDSEAPAQPSRKSAKVLTGLLLIVTALLGNTFAANINISTGGNQEFGQGILITTACDKSITLVPISTYIQDNSKGEHRLTSVKISGLDTTEKLGESDEGCRGKSFKVSAYSETSTLLIAQFTMSVNPDGTIQSGDGITSASGEGSALARVDVLFEDSAFTSTNIYRFTIESLDKSYVLTKLINPFPSETLAALTSTEGDVLFLMTADTDINGNCNTCKLYRSLDFGYSWSFRGTLPDYLWHIVGSADGVRLVGANWGGKIFTSNDSGATWVDRGNSDAWWHFSSSSSGQLIAGVTEKIGFKISRDYGLSWSSPLPAPAGSFIQSAISSDGTKILLSDQRILRYSNDSGATWAERGAEKNWSAVAMSANGSHLYAAEYKDIGQTTGRIYKSTDNGLTWQGTSISNSWWGIKTTPNGKTVVAFASDKVDTAFISNDYGKTWQRSTSPLYIDTFAVKKSGEEVLFLGGPILWGKIDLYRMNNPKGYQD